MKYSIKITQNAFTIWAYIANVLSNEKIVLYKQDVEQTVTVFTEEFDKIKSLPQIDFSKPLEIEIFHHGLNKKAGGTGKFNPSQKLKKITSFIVDLNLPLSIQYVTAEDIEKLI